MCLAVPGKVCALHDEDGLRVATVDFGGVRKRICVETLPDVALGAWVLVHAGIALQQIDADAAAESLRLLVEATSRSEAPPR
jgi:hydrogenase expression/formation protein HypC